MSMQIKVKRAKVAIVVALTITVFATGCSSAKTNSSDSASTQETAAVNDSQPAYETAGPYAPGVTTLDMDGRKVEVWYPADKGAEAGHSKDVFRISTLLPDGLKSVIPDAIDPRYETDAFRDITASPAGPFPIVLFSHGFSGYPTMYAFLLTHLASWGFVVIAPDHTERGLLAGVTQCVKYSDDAKVLLGARDFALGKNNDSASILHGTMDPSRVATLGHSAGAAAAVATAEDPSVSTFIALDGGGTGAPKSTTPPVTSAAGCLIQAPAGSDPSATTTIPAGAMPDKPGMIITGGNDQVIPLSRLQPIYDAMTTPKRLVVIDGAGHNSVSDICLIGADQGGLIVIAGKVGINVPPTIAGLFNDGCAAGGNYPDVKQVWEVPRHFVVAQLRSVFGIDSEPVGLGPAIADAFPPLTLQYQSSN